MRERHSKNPFIKNMMIPVRNRQVKISKLGRDDNVLINKGTGEEMGTHVTAYKKVDSQRFVKLFSENIGLTFDLGSAGVKAFNVLIYAVQHQEGPKDQVAFDRYQLDEFLQKNKLKLSIATMQRGIRELEKAKIIAKAMRAGWYYINPNFCFNGDRIAFTTMIERNSNEELK